MTKVIGPLFSTDASGTIKDSLTFSIWKGTNYVRSLSFPSNPKTTAQQANRTTMATAVTAWQALYSGTKDDWNLAARDVYPPISGFNYYVMQYILQAAPPTIPPIAPKRSKTLHHQPKTPAAPEPPTPPFTPLSIDDCSLWLRPDLGVTSSANKLSQYLDQSPSGILFSQPVEDYRYTIIPSYVAGQTALLCDGSNDFMLSTREDLYETTFFGSNEGTIFIICKPTQWSGGGFSLPYLSGSTLFYAPYNEALGILFDFMSNDEGPSGGRLWVPVESNFINNWQIIIARRSPLNVQSVRINRSVAASATRSATANHGPGPMTLDNAWGTFFGGYRLDIALYKRALSDDEVSLLEDYALSRYSI